LFKFSFVWGGKKRKKRHTQMNKKLLVRSFFLCVCVCVCGGRVQQLINSSRCLLLLPTEMAYTYQSSFSLSLYNH
jgi:hypothetical protein